MKNYIAPPTLIQKKLINYTHFYAIHLPERERRSGGGREPMLCESNRGYYMYQSFKMHSTAATYTQVNSFNCDLQSRTKITPLSDDQSV